MTKFAGQSDLTRRSLLPLPACGERVGVRGPFHKLGLVERPPHPARKSAPTSPRKRGEVKAAASCDYPAHKSEGRRGTVFALTLAIATVTALASPPRANADDLLKLTIGQRGNWDTAIAQLGTKAGIFKKNGIELEMVYTSGSGETLQPIIGGAVDVGLAVGTLGAIAAYAKGAPVRIIGAQATGAADYWYVKTSSPAKKLTDLTDRNTIAFSTNGSSTNSIVRAFIDEFKLKVKPMATGNPSSTLTAVMTDQVDVGWASPPFGLKEIEEGKTRVVARATESALVRGQTIRVIVANTDALAKRKDAIGRFMKGYRETIAYMYGDNPQVMKDYGEFAGVSEVVAKRVRNDFFPKSLVDPDEIHGLDALMAEAVTLKFIAAPLMKEQVAELVQTVK
jgi:NitT/TauT family transport system substrate-binding protein